MTYRIVALEGVDGSGKSTLLKSLQTSLSTHAKVVHARPARALSKAFRRIAEDGRPENLYQDALPAHFRHSAYLLESAVQFRYEQQRFEQADFVIFDRWRHTWAVYCEDVVEHRDWFARIETLLPHPDVLFWLRVDPEVAYERLVARQDRWVEAYSPAGLRAKITKLCERYEEVMRASGAVVLDGTGPAAEVHAEALAALAAEPTASAG
ncbi:AAA family ATPase [Streptomyces durbertensis]|uniref:Thymidylate kinase n=1 Tax=Streptomyces durbertensis TaxID=2448886 RepID=A0ABR6EFF1_9ACTN|nr:AAA family ATPase [Streptomyces durbertensis]MBB1244056.1 AAA family ATPase [Streptomyces durbertensis]